MAVAARARPDLEETARLVTAAGRRALVVETDVTAYPQVEALVRRTIAELGGLHVVVNNSGIARVAPVAQMSPEDFRATLEVNLVGVFNGCRAAAAHLLAQKAGKVINLSSVLGQVGLPGYSAYAASKSGVMGFTRALAAEWARHGIQVNAIAPGWFVTEMNAEAFADERTRDRLLRDVPLRRTGRLDEIGPLVVYLASARLRLHDRPDPLPRWRPLGGLRPGAAARPDRPRASRSTRRRSPSASSAVPSAAAACACGSGGAATRSSARSRPAAPIRAIAGSCRAACSPRSSTACTIAWRSCAAWSWR